MIAVDVVSAVSEFLRNIGEHAPALLLPAIVASLTSTAATVRDVLMRYFERRSKLRAAAESEFAAVLASSDLAALGYYLEGTLGAFTVAEYTADPAVRARVDQMIKRLQDFLGTTAEVASQAHDVTEAAGAHATDASVGAVAVSALSPADEWNALASLRRDLELSLRRLAQAHGVDIKPYASALQVARVLSLNGLLSVNSEARLRDVIHVANRAVHGLRVSPEEAALALADGRQVLQALAARGGGA